VTEETTETTFGDDAKSDASVPWEPIGEDALSGVLFGENSDDSLNSNFSDNEFDQGTKESLEIDTLFDSLQPEDEKLLFSFPESSQKDTSEQNVDVAITNAAVPEEEVVFELFEEEAELGGIDVDVSALEPAEPSPATAMQAEAAEVTLPGFTGVHEIDDVSVVDMAIIEETIGSEPLGNLRACIDSLGIELEDKIIAGLFQEINKLRQKWPDRPIEKTFLQLLSTITQHIDMYRYESSAEAHSLLLSVYQVLANLQVGDLKRNQEMLLGETLRVLQWQQDMLVRQAVKRGKELTFVDPVRGDRENSNLADAQKDFDQILESSEETLEDEISSTDSIESITGYPLDSHDRAGVGDHTATLVTPGFTEKDETPLPIKAELSKETFSDDLRKEIAMLRQTLQREIAELRKELKES
jgi:pilus assembly protein FimV